MKKRICAAALAGTLLVGPAAGAVDDSQIPDWLNPGASGTTSSSSTSTQAPKTSTKTPVPSAPVSAGAYPIGTTWNADGTPKYPAGTVINADGTLTGPDGRLYTPYTATILPSMTAAEATAYLRAQDPELTAAAMLTYNEVESLVRKGNLTILSNSETLEGIEAVDLDDAIDELEDAIDDLRDVVDNLEDLSDDITGSMGDMGDAIGRLEDEMYDIPDGDFYSVGDVITDLASAMLRYQTALGKGTITNLQMQIMSLKTQIEQMEDQIDTLEDTDYEEYERQFENIENQIVMGAQSAYIGLATLQQNYVSLMQQADLTNVKLTEMQTRFKLGQVSDLDVAEVEDAKLTVDSAIETIKLNLRNTKGDLNVLMGRATEENFILDALPVIQPAQLSQMNLENDLARGKKASYDIYAAELAVEKAEDLDKKDDGRKNKIRAAEYTLESTEKSFEQNFRKLFRAVAEKNRLITVAEEAQKLEARKVATEKLKYERGMISRNDLLEAEIDKAKADSEVKIAQINLFSAYMQYDWATRGVISGSSGGMA